MSVPAVQQQEHPEHTGFHARLSRYFDVQSILVPVCAVVLAVLAGSVVMLLVGENPITAYKALFEGMWGSWDRIAASLGRSTPFIGAALAVAFAFRAGLFNIGVEGQLLVGATFAAWIGTWGVVDSMPGVLAIIAVLFAGLVGGALWGLIPGVLKAKTGAHEVITTIMLNSIAVFYVRWMVSSQDPIILRDTGASVPRTRVLPEDARLPSLVHVEPPLQLGFFIMIGLCVVSWFVLQQTTKGFEIRTVGANPHAARYAGVRVGAIIVLVMSVAGSFAGLAGGGEVSGTTGFLSPGVFAAIGFDSIAIALLARANPFAIIPAAILWGSMLSGAPYMQQTTGLSIDVVRIVQALVLLFIAADVIVRTVFRIRRHDRGTGAMQEARLGANWSST